jgi:hypothetical protein
MLEVAASACGKGLPHSLTSLRRSWSQVGALLRVHGSCWAGVASWRGQSRRHAGPDACDLVALLDNFTQKPYSACRARALGPGGAPAPGA